MIVRPSVVLVNPLDDLQAALTAASPGSVVQLGAGTFTPTAWVDASANAGGPTNAKRWLSIPSGVILRGQGEATKLVLPAVTNNAIVYAGVLFDDCVGGGIENLQIQGSQADGVSGCVIGVYIVGASSRITTSGVLFAGVSASTGVNICWDIGNVVATDLGYHVAERCTVTSCIGTATGRGLAFDVNDSSNNVIRNNRVTFLANDGRHGVYLAGKCTNNRVENNYFNGGTQQAIQCYNQNTTGQISTLNVVKNNWITGSKGIIVSLRCDFNEVSGNTVINSLTDGISLAGDGTTTTQVTKNNVVKGNYIYMPQGRGIVVSGTQGSVVSGNVIYGANQSNTSLAGIHVLWAGNTSLVTGVRIVGNTVFADAAIKHREALVIDPANTPPSGTLVAGNSFDLGTNFSFSDGGTGTIAYGNAMSDGATTATIASGATITLTGAYSFFTISGTADVTSITASWIGRVVTLIFSGTKATNGLVDGSNLKLAGTLAYTPDDTITLLCDGTNWVEMSRSVN